MGDLKFYNLPPANRKKEGSNPASYPKTAFGIYGFFNKKSGSKNPERLDAVGFAPTASKVLGCYAILLPKGVWKQVITAK